MGNTLDYKAMYDAITSDGVFDRPVLWDVAGQPSHAAIAVAMRETATWVREAPDDERIHGHLRDSDGRFCALGKLIQLTDSATLGNYLPMLECDPTLITRTFDLKAYETCARTLEAMATFLETLAEPEDEDELEDSLAVESRELALV